MTTGVFALENGGPIDFAAMRQGRLQRALDAMKRHNLDVLMVAKPANIKYVSGSRSLWTAGRRPFSPSAIVLRDTRAVHLMTLWDEGVPKEIPIERLFPMSWNPMQLMERVVGIVGRNRKGRIGVDQMSPFFSQTLAKSFPNASVVDGAQAMTEARAIKTPEEIECIKMSLQIAEASLVAAIQVLRSGVAERDLLATFEQEATTFGVTQPVAQGGFCVQPLSNSVRPEPTSVRGESHSSVRGEPVEPRAARAAPLLHRSSARLIQTGDLVTMTCGVLYAGYESDVGRTWLCAPAKANSKQRSLHKRWLDTYQAMLKECRPGRTAADLRKAAENTVRPEPHSSVRGEPIARPEASRREPRSWTPPAPVAHAVGLGFEPPIAGSDLGAEAESRMTLQAGMVLVLQPYIWEAGIGGYLAKETVLVTKAAPQRLSTLPYGPLA